MERVKGSPKWGVEPHANAAQWGHETCDRCAEIAKWRHGGPAKRVTGAPKLRGGGMRALALWPS
eukprot:4105976-Pyramimonas_sp.AAC.1